jgi:hypothetical protein
MNPAGRLSLAPWKHGAPGRGSTWKGGEVEWDANGPPSPKTLLRRSSATPRCSGRSATCGGIAAGARAADWLERLDGYPGSRPPPSVLTRAPTGATAPWRQPRSCASGQWRPMRPCRRHRQGALRQSGGRPRSGMAAPWTVLGSTSSSRPRTRTIRCCGCSVTRPSPCRCGRSRHRVSSGQMSRPRLEPSTSRSRRPMRAAGATGSGATPEESGTSSGA